MRSQRTHAEHPEDLKPNICLLNGQTTDSVFQDGCGAVAALGGRVGSAVDEANRHEGVGPRTTTPRDSAGVFGAAAGPYSAIRSTRRSAGAEACTKYVPLSSIAV